MAQMLGLALSPDQIDAANAGVWEVSMRRLRTTFQLLRRQCADADEEGRCDLRRLHRDAEAMTTPPTVFRGAGLETVNGWVAEKTKGKIGSILDRLDPVDGAGSA